METPKTSVRVFFNHHIKVSKCLIICTIVSLSQAGDKVRCETRKTSSSLETFFFVCENINVHTKRDPKRLREIRNTK